MTKHKFNAVLVLIMALPAFAIVASVGTALVAVTSGDPTLPDEYHWEGDKLDHDFADSMRAAQLHLGANLDLGATDGICYMTLRIDQGAPPAVDVNLIHISQPALDRRMKFVRIGTTSSYAASCSPLAAGRWHVEVSDSEGSWSFRDEAAGDMSAVHISAGS